MEEVLTGSLNCLMKRIPEPELMVDPEQVLAYAHADFEDPHSNFVKLFKENFADVKVKGRILDLGCGPGDITFRFASEFKDAHIDGIDGSGEMINFANELLSQKNELSDRVNFICSMINDYNPDYKYDYIHHFNFNNYLILSGAPYKVFLHNTLKIS